MVYLNSDFQFEWWQCKFSFDRHREIFTNAESPPTTHFQFRELNRFFFHFCCVWCRYQRRFCQPSMLQITQIQTRLFITSKNSLGTPLLIAISKICSTNWFIRIKFEKFYPITFWSCHQWQFVFLFLRRLIAAIRAHKNVVESTAFSYSLGVSTTLLLFVVATGRPRAASRPTMGPKASKSWV